MEMLPAIGTQALTTLAGQTAGNLFSQLLPGGRGSAGPMGSATPRQPMPFPLSGSGVASSTPGITIPTRVPAAGDVSGSGFEPASGALEILLKRLMTR